MMQTVERRWVAAAAAVVLGLAGATLGGAEAQAATYPKMAAPAAYRTESREAEIAMARSAAPASISDKAEILVLGDAGYETAAKGSNGFVCVVVRAWAMDFGEAEFWNPKIRAPNCFNPQSVNSVVAAYLTRTKWVLSGVSVPEMESRTKAMLKSGAFRPPEPGAMCYMMSKQGYTDDNAAGPWRPHLMFYVAGVKPDAWGANLPGVPVMGGASPIEPLSVFFITVATWSDGSPGSGAGQHTAH